MGALKKRWMREDPVAWEDCRVTRRKCLTALVSGLAAGLILPVTAGAQEAAAPSLSLPNAATALEVNGDTGEESKEASLPVFNASAAAIQARVRLEAADPGGIELSGGPVEHTVPAGGATAIPLTFTGLEDVDDEKVSGQLVVTGGAAPLLRGVTITPGPQPALPWPLVIVLVSLLPAVVVFVLIAAQPSEPWEAFDRPAPGLSLDVSKSFATTLTTLGAVATVVLAGVTYPAVPDEISKDSITELGLLFAALAVVGPFIYLGLRSAAPRNRAEAHSGNTWDPPPPPEAYVDLTGGKLGLILTCCATLVAVTGQLLTAVLLSWELLGGGVAAVAIAVLVAAVIVLAANYTYWAIRDFVARDWGAEAEAAWKKAQAAPAAEAPVEGVASTGVVRPEPLSVRLL